jgi:hypothetical protein
MALMGRVIKKKSAIGAARSQRMMLSLGTVGAYGRSAGGPSHPTNADLQPRPLRHGYQARSAKFPVIARTSWRTDRRKRLQVVGQQRSWHPAGNPNEINNRESDQGNARTGAGNFH